MTISAVGSLAVANGVNNVTVNPTTVGDVLVLNGTDNVGGYARAINAVSGGGVPATGPGSWTRLSGGELGGSTTQWFGVVSVAGVASVNVSNKAGVYTATALAVQQFTGGTVGTWASDGSGSVAGVTSSSGNYPSLTSTGDNELYVGVFKAFGSSPGGATAGFTYANPIGATGYEASSCFVYKVVATAGTASSPAWSQGSSSYGVSAGLLTFTPGAGSVFTITFDPNSGSGTMPALTGSAPITLPLNVYTRTGYIFNGWNTAAGGSGISAQDGDTFNFLFANLTLYAQWIATNPPSAPTLSAPTNASYADVSGGIVLGPASYNSTSGEPQNAFALRLKASGGSYGYWNGTDFSSATVIWNTDSVAVGDFWSVTIPGGVLTNGNVYNWSMASQDDTGAQGAFASDFTFTAQAAPTVTVTAPTGTDTTTSDPVVTWTETLGGSAVQTGYEVIVESGSYGTVPGSGTVAWDSDVISSSALTVTIGVLLNSPLTYRVFVQITETGGLVSAWGYTTFNLAVTPPATPILTVTPGNDGVTGAPINTLSIQANNGAWGGAALTFNATFTDDGANYFPVRNGTGIAIGNSATATLIDYEAPLGFTRTYSVQLVAG